MLQQTRVATVIPYYQRWLRSFPTVGALARARPARVLKHWEGLGYYARVRHLHRAARQVIRDGFPRAATDWRRLPGVGRYTAGAIASIAFGERAPLVDGNVARVLSRVFRVTGNIKAPATLERLWSLSHLLVPDRKPGEFNQALMELGALVCAPLNPKCLQCPLRGICRSPTDSLPDRGPSRPVKRVTQDVLLARCGSKVWMRPRGPATRLLAGMWELPAGKSSQLLGVFQCTITSHRITLRVFACSKRPPSSSGRWITLRDMERLSFPAAHRRVLQRIFHRKM